MNFPPITYHIYACTIVYFSSLGGRGAQYVIAPPNTSLDKSTMHEYLQPLSFTSSSPQIFSLSKNYLVQDSFFTQGTPIDIGGCIDTFQVLHKIESAYYCYTEYFILSYLKSCVTRRVKTTITVVIIVTKMLKHDGRYLYKTNTKSRWRTKSPRSS